MRDVDHEPEKLTYLIFTHTNCWVLNSVFNDRHL